MTHPVDVMAVMGADAAHAEAYRIVYGVIDATPAAMAEESAKARAAVAELIEAVEGYLSERKWYNPLYANKRQYEMFAAAEARLNAAISRVRGVA